MKKTAVIVFALFAAITLFAQGNYDNAAKEAAPGVELTMSVFKPTEAQAAEIQEKMGNKFPVPEEFVIYSGKDTKVVIDEQRGRWSMIKIAVAIDTKNGRVANIVFIHEQEKRGKAIKSGNFYRQFFNKALSDDLEINKGIRGVSGATISSRAVSIIVKRALIVSGM